MSNVLTREELWQDSKWQKEFFTTVSQVLEEKGIHCLCDTFTSMRIMAWSFVGKIETTNGSYYAKSVSSTANHEPIVTKILSQTSPFAVETVEASDDGWILTAGLNANEVIPFQAVVSAVKRYAQLQYASSKHSEAIVASGIPVVKLGEAEERLDSVLARFRNLPEAHPSHFSKAEHDFVASAKSIFVETDKKIMQCSIPSTIEHGDLLPKNLLFSEDYKTLRWFDFGDSSWAFPFVSLDMLTDRQISGYTTQQIKRLKDAYLKTWSAITHTGVGELRKLFNAAMVQAALRRAEMRLDIMEAVPVEALGEMAPVAKDDFLRAVGTFKKFERSIYNYDC